MTAYFMNLSPLEQALIATIFTWLLTGVGAALVFTTRDINMKLFDSMLGFAGGVMVAASFWSLLLPAFEMSGVYNDPAWLPVAGGFASGGAFLAIANRLLPHLHPTAVPETAEGHHPERKRRSTLLVFAITLHNIPEGFAIGIAFGGAAAGMPSATLAGAGALVLGIGLQNIPEGAAVSMPLRRDGLSRRKSFLIGHFSGMMEPIAAVIGVLAVSLVEPLLPFALGFAAGAMIFVVVEEVIPGSQENGNKNVATICLLGGFLLMTVLVEVIG
ncbi:ZIP family metal transporter [Salisediminibacterium halotolerans]|uniref:Zinc transporter, ZIP family n=1 Tax=Salisediminibacterium halotolerans TaxID=517425 RepID=A0A1H9WGW5_9BACI|nr:ZIP family metal transporter [Salisediminibacterium haloalkalitolerans]SES33085.1 zinc transporter, ZIP family [Salisediminibacterium haloalkalitolerans]